MKTTVIVPMAGRSTRYPGVRPKWMLTGADGVLMFRMSVELLQFDDVDEIVFVVREEHAAQLEATAVIERQLASHPLPVPHRVVVVPPTASQPETVALATRLLGIDGPIFIKDVDNRFSCAPRPGNLVAVAELNEHDRIDPTNKSYVTVDPRGMISGIVEKRIVSSQFCVGGYGFASAAQFREHFDRLRQQADLYVSHVIFDLLLAGTPFQTAAVSRYEDWGTLADWRTTQARHGTIFVDLDGTLVRNSAEHFAPRWGETPALAANLAALNQLSATGNFRIIVTTSRRSTAEAITRQQLATIGLRYDQILFDLPHGRRYLINDFAESNPHPSAVAINLPRDEDSLAGLLATWFPDAALDALVDTREATGTPEV